MTGFHSQSDRAERALINELRHGPGPDPLVEAVRECVAALTRMKRDAGEPPEKVIVAIKEAAGTSGAAAELDLVRPLIPGSTADIVHTMVDWCIETYYEQPRQRAAAN